MAFQFKIQLMDVANPPVWRKVLVSDEITLDDFHDIIQAAFGWGNHHLYRFSKDKWKSEIQYSIPSEWDYFEVTDSREIKIDQVFQAPGQDLFYLYDFGDDWFHNITLELISDEKIISPLFIEGNGACPPEDCGGPRGYQRLLEMLSDPKNPQYKETRQWLGLKRGEHWDVNYFDKNEANERLQLT